MQTTTTDEVQAREARHILQTYRRSPVTFVRGQGVRLWDAEGREYLDLLSGIGVASLGHAHPGLARAIADQVQTLIHTSNLFFHPLQGQVAERLATLSGLSRAFFCNSGAEAVEACLKFARRYWHTKGILDRTEIMAIGDNMNDHTMLAAAGVPVVMANAVPELKAFGWPETASNDDAGVAEAIERYILKN